MRVFLLSCCSNRCRTCNWSWRCQIRSHRRTCPHRADWVRKCRTWSSRCERNRHWHWLGFRNPAWYRLYSYCLYSLRRSQPLRCRPRRMRSCAWPVCCRCIHKIHYSFRLRSCLDWRCRASLGPGTWPALAKCTPVRSARSVCPGDRWHRRVPCGLNRSRNGCSPPMVFSLIGPCSCKSLWQYPRRRAWLLCKKPHCRPSGWDRSTFVLALPYRRYALRLLHRRIQWIFRWYPGAATSHTECPCIAENWIFNCFNCRSINPNHSLTSLRFRALIAPASNNTTTVRTRIEMFSLYLLTLLYLLKVFIFTPFTQKIGLTLQA